MHALLNWVWQGVAVAAALYLMLRAIDGVRASVRYVVCGLALVIVLVIPVLWALPLIAAPHAAARVAGPVIAVPDTLFTSPALLFALWSIWVFIQAVLVSRSLLAAQRIRAACRPFPAAIERRLQHWMRVRSRGRRTGLVISDHIGRAAMLGCGRPTIAVAPALLERLSAPELDQVVIHEWAHAQRRDDLAGLVQLAIRIVAGWHPAVWWIDRHLRIEREVACDEAAVAIAGSPKSYATCLVTLSELSATSPVLLASPGVMMTGGLRYRVTRILSHRPAWPARRAHGIAAVMVGVLLVLAVGAGRFEVFAATLVEPEPDAISSMLTSRTLEDLPFEARSARAAAPAAADERPLVLIASSPRRSEPLLPAAAPAQDPLDSHAAEPVNRASPDDRPETTAEADAPDTDSTPASPVSTAADETPIAAPARFTAAGDAGVEIARRSKEAGIATAGAFTRFARRVAGAF